MLSFQVFDEMGPAHEFPLVLAHMLGRDDIAIRSEITFRDGVVRCRRRGPEAAALCLLHDAGQMGRLMLQTCLLPDRDQPYVLSLELARHRIKQFIAKSEEWQMFELGAEHPAMREWERARESFTLAANETDPVAADRHARGSLVCAIEATERLARAHAQILLHRRFGTRAASSTTLGLGVWAGAPEEPIREVLQREADVVTIPLRWRELERSEGKYDWTATDRWMAWAAERKKPIIAGPLLDFSPEALPSWMHVWQNDFDTTRAMAYDHMAKVVDRYRSVVNIWNLAAGINVNDHFQFAPDQMLNLVRTAVVLVRQARRGARTMVELTQPFGEHAAFRRDSVSPLIWVDRLVQEGLRLDAIGVRLQFGVSSAGRATRDLFQISDMLDRLVHFDLPVMVTGVGVPSETIDPNGGHWHDSWTPQRQAEWIAQVFPVALSKPFVEAFIWGDIADHAGQDVASSGLLTERCEVRPAFVKVTGMRRRLRKPIGLLRDAERAAAAEP